jgi:hypothetical protein
MNFNPATQLNNTLGDGVDANDKPLLTAFPYLSTPHQVTRTPTTTTSGPAAAIRPAHRPVIPSERGISCSQSGSPLCSMTRRCASQLFSDGYVVGWWWSGR